MNKKICFIANQKKTYFFNGIARELIKAGYEIFWITVSERLKEELVAEYGADKVLVLHRHMNLNSIADFKLNEIVLSDRSLRIQKSWAYSYLKGAQVYLYDFIKNNQICTIFGEVTWAHEMLTHRMTVLMSELNCKYITPHTVRMPSGYFGFFGDEVQSELIPRPAGMEFEKIALKVVKPDYLHLNDKIVKSYYSLSQRLSRLKSFILSKEYEEGNPCMIHSKSQKLGVYLRREINRELYRFVRPRKLELSIETTDYVLYPLHKQPEASVDVMGRYYDDQYLNILNIWRGLPEGWLLLVKEHSNAIGDRSLGFYKKLTKLKDVFLVGENEDSHNLIKHAASVFTVSGTAAYEAALMGKSSFTFAKSFFNKLALCDQLTLEQLRSSSIKDLIELQSRGESTKLELSQYEDWISARLFKGIISDPDSNAACMDPENLVNVARAFQIILGQSLASR
ncbi:MULTISPECIES: capsular polysaccharide export protein, LipB/KpsS family [Pseudomonas]|uniref:capsular polysaccharide export protein, LipB/KpsS family n=2 Tax=Pseudomonas TaxID=286 RepID=UPI001F3EBE38|nr:MULTISPECIES: hypothetical protein [unclassified Pseudomonas]